MLTVFRMGELHITFAVLEAIGKFIDNSGLGNCLIESGIYGPATIGENQRWSAHETVYRSILHTIHSTVSTVPGESPRDEL